jgi:hypothetical protein
MGAVSSHRRNSHDGVIAKIAPRRLSDEASRSETRHYGLGLTAQLRGTKCYVALGVARRGRLFLLGSTKNPLLLQAGERPRKSARLEEVRKVELQLMVTGSERRGRRAVETDRVESPTSSRSLRMLGASGCRAQ